MKLAVVCLIVICIIVVSAQPQGYTTKYDNINVDQILHNDRLLKRYTDCLLERTNARCPPEAAEMKGKYTVHIICIFIIMSNTIK